MKDALHPAIEQHYAFLNQAQRQAAAHIDGPLLIIAAPGSGKTLVLVVRTLNILLQGKAEPQEIVLCTFTKKAAFELRDRVAQAARTLGYTGDLSQLQVGTVHSICNDHLTRFRHHTWLGAGYEVLDELTQALAGYRPISDAQRKAALDQVKNYFEQNQDRMAQVIETEVDVSLEKERYVLTGRVDLLLGEDDKLELLDFKSQPRPEKDDRRLRHYYQQLLVYAHILEQRYGKHPERLALYWTGEARRKDALMIFPYEPDKVDEAGAYFDSVVARILARDFAVTQPPETKVCAECDFRAYCQGQGTIRIATNFTN